MSKALFPLSAIINLAAAVSLFFGLLYIGKLIIGFFFNIDEPWKSLVGFFLGYFLFGLIVQSFAYFNIVEYLYIYVIIFVIFIGLLYSIACFWSANLKQWYAKDAILPIVIVSLSLSLLLVTSLAPSTKIDELNYSMMIPARIYLDGALNYYTHPWEGSIYSSLFYQISQTPFIGLGLPDAPNTLSYIIFLFLLWFTGGIVRKSTGNLLLLWWVIAVMAVGMYSIVDLTTSGSHSLLVLSTVTALLAIICKDSFFKRTSTFEWIVICQLLLLGMATSKASVIPLVIILNIIIVIQAFKIERNFAKIFLYVATPWLIFYLPILIWSYIEIGSFYGPIFGGKGGGLLAKSVQNLLGYTGNFYDISLFTLVNWSPAIWLALFFVIINKRIHKKTRLLISLLFLFQLLVIIFLLPNKARHFSGLQYLPIIMLALTVIKTTKFNKKKTNYVGFFLTVPWLLMQLYYSTIFIGVVSGITNTEGFYKKYISYYDDFVYLDKILPSNAQVLALGARFNLSSFPRRVYADLHHLDRKIPTYLFYVGYDELLAIKKELKICGMIYENNQATKYTFRTPGKENIKTKLRVFKICAE